MVVIIVMVVLHVFNFMDIIVLVKFEFGSFAVYHVGAMNNVTAPADSGLLER